MKMRQELEKGRSQMFTLRVWVEDVGNGRSEIRGTLKHVLSGESHHFRDWATLTTLLQQWFKNEAEAETP
jgi:hypothetical protein